MPKKAKHPVRTTETTLAIIETLDESDGANITELDSRLDVGKSAIHNHLSTLREHGYVFKADNEYHLGLKFLSIGGNIRENNQLYRKSKYIIENLEQGTEESFTLLTEEYGRGAVLYHSKGNQTVAKNIHIGQRPYLHSTAGGKAILAELPTDHVERILKQHGLPRKTENTITNRDELFEHLDQIHDQGYATNKGEWLASINGIGTVITNGNNTVLGALSIVKPANSHTRDIDDDVIIERIQEGADMIESDIGYPWESDKFISAKHISL